MMITDSLHFAPSGFALSIDTFTLPRQSPFFPAKILEMSSGLWYIGYGQKPEDLNVNKKPIFTRRNHGSL